MAIVFRVDGTPGPQGSKKGFVNPKNGRVIMVESSAKVKPWRALVAHAAKEEMRKQKAIIMTSDVFMIATYYWKRPKSHYGKKGLKADAPTFVKTKPDLSKLQRSTEDALTGIVFVDDSQIVSMSIKKRYGEPGAIIHIGETLSDILRITEEANKEKYGA
jgi:Holliday junction resolvase RusA-like endonuclease